MDDAAFDRLCGALPKAERVVQWGGRTVWKVGGKVFAIGGAEGDGAFAVTFKCSAATFETLRAAPGVRPAPYLASRGMTWLQRTGPGALDDEALAAYIRESWRLALARLTKVALVELDLLSAVQRH